MDEEWEIWIEIEKFFLFLGVPLFSSHNDDDDDEDRV